MRCVRRLVVLRAACLAVIKQRRGVKAHSLFKHATQVRPSCSSEGPSFVTRYCFGGAGRGVDYEVKDWPGAGGHGGDASLAAGPYEGFSLVHNSTTLDASAWTPALEIFRLVEMDLISYIGTNECSSSSIIYRRENGRELLRRLLRLFPPRKI